MSKKIYCMLCCCWFSAIIWYEEQEKSVQEVSVNGRRLGVTNKDLNSSRARCVTTTNLFHCKMITRALQMFTTFYKKFPVCISQMLLFHPFMLTYETKIFAVLCKKYKCFKFIHGQSIRFIWWNTTPDLTCCLFSQWWLMSVADVPYQRLNYSEFLCSYCPRFLLANDLTLWGFNNFKLYWWINDCLICLLCYILIMLAGFCKKKLVKCSIMDFLLIFSQSYCMQHDQLLAL